MGNENNFASAEDCDAQCTAFLPHQLQGTGTASDSDDDDWSRNFELSDSPCHEPAFVMGRCRAALSRWSWNSETLACEEFVYGGCSGNGNNFRSQRKCNRECEHFAVAARNFYDDVLNIDEEEEEEEEPEETEEQRKERICALDKQMGPCRARFDRFYYDASTNKCKPFTFGGCEGNENNFASRSDCKELCVNEMVNDFSDYEEEEAEPEEEEESELPEPRTINGICGQQFGVSGFCRGYFQRWAFDGESCKMFVWGGCGGNENNFQSEDACNDECSPAIAPKAGMLYDVVDDDEEEDEDDDEDDSNDDIVDLCSLSIERGPCRALYPKYAFDGENCVSFMYGGCMGNANNFGSLSECRAECMMAADVVDDDEEEDENQSNPAAIFPTCTTTGAGNFKGTRYGSKMSCTSLGNSHHSGDPATQFLHIDGLTDSPSGERLKTFVERFPNLKILIINNVEINDVFDISLPENIVIFISNNCGWTAIESNAFVRAQNLKEINMSYNAINRFTANQFRSQKYLVKADFSDNALADIREGLFTGSGRSFTELVLDGNAIQTFGYRTFFGLRKLKKLSVKNNPMNAGLPDHLFAHNPQFKCILLANSGIAEMSKNIFSSSKNPKLRQVDLTGCAALPAGLRKDWGTKKKVQKLMTDRKSVV